MPASQVLELVVALELDAADRTLEVVIVEDVPFLRDQLDETR